MQNVIIPTWQHTHAFGQDKKRESETRTTIVIILTALMMVAEISAGLLFGSIALLADGLHMASHAVALVINVFAYIYARRYAHHTGFSFGTGKVNALGGFTGAVLLAVFALIMAWESLERLLNPVEIAFNQAILVAIIGLVVNGVSAFILGEQHDHAEHGHEHHHEHDHNRRAAYLHVLADALTSVLAIFALLAGKYFGWLWMDPLSGIVGAILVSRWSLGLIRASSEVLLDKQATSLVDEVKEALTKESDAALTDVHVWCIGPNIYSAIVTILTSAPKSPCHYRQLLAPVHELVHVTVEVNQPETPPAAV